MKKIIKSERNYRLDIPALIMKGMNWEDDEVEIFPEPVKGEIIIKNPHKKPVGFTRFFLNVDDAKWIRNKKKYQHELSQNLTPEARKILHETNWEKIGRKKPRLLSLETISSDHSLIKLDLHRIIHDLRILRSLKKDIELDIMKLEEMKKQEVKQEK